MLSFAFVLLVQSPAPNPDAIRIAMEAFRARAEVAGQAYERAQDASLPLLREGRLDAAIARLVDAVPEKERTAAHAFMLGNVLFDLSPEVSGRFHEEAWRQEPLVPPVVYEWALQQHRARRYREAEELYASLIQGGVFAAPPVRALRADCLLHLGRFADAVQEWKTADPGQHHSEIEQAACWIYGPKSPYARRCELLARATKGGADGGLALEQAVLLDLGFDRDWWNVGREDEFLQHDLALAKKAFGEGSARWKELDLLVRAKTALEAANPMEDLMRKMRKDAAPKFDLAGEAKAVGVWGEAARLPASSLVASNLFALFVEHQVATEAELGQRFAAELATRGDAGDVEALEVLAAIHAATDPSKLAQVDEQGWEKHRDVRFGGSLLSSRADAVRSDDPLLAALLAHEPADVVVARIYVQACMREKKALVEPLARVAMAEFQHMTSYADTSAALRELERVLAKK
ncbi:MAG: hypothetical protein IPJ77_10415 [Planctomycetes bacterium]|nr:hypothetical protein [Planctomycetota bacterium]